MGLRSGRAVVHHVCGHKDLTAVLFTRALKGIRHFSKNGICKASLVTLIQILGQLIDLNNHNSLHYLFINFVAVENKKKQVASSKC